MMAGSQESKLCLIIPSLQAGGMERIMSEIANQMVQRNIHVWLVLMFRYEVFYPLDEKIHLVAPRRKKRFNLTYAFFLFPYLRFRTRRIRPDAILSFGERYNSYVLLATLGLRIPVFISDRSSPRKQHSRFNRGLSRLLYGRADGIISQTRSAAAMIGSRLEGSSARIRVIPNPLREIKVPEVPKKNQVVALGRLVREKRYDRLVEIISRLKNTSWDVVIVGGGRMQEAIEQQIAALGLQERVHLAGQQKEVDRFLAESRIYVLTSEMEGYPNALCEAMAHGLACISFDCVAGPSDIIRDGQNGILVENGDIERFAGELDRLITNEALRSRLGAEARKIRDELSREKVVQRYEEFLFSE